MKLRNKKTGEICEFMIHKRIEDSEDGNPVYAPFADSVEDWEDYEEKGWYIDLSCNDIKIYEDLCLPEEVSEKLKEIGNYFETKEEAEKAVGKLKAWKRLKDKDFQFHGHNALGVGEITFSLDFEDMDDEGEIGQLRHDLDLLFGGEE